MKKYTIKEKRDILRNLRAGVIYAGVEKNISINERAERFPFIAPPVMYIVNGRGKNGRTEKFIYWRYYGGSCNRVNLEGITFILEKIFKDCSEVVPVVYDENLHNYVTI